MQGLTILFENKASIEGILFFFLKNELILYIKKLKRFCIYFPQRNTSSMGKPCSLNCIQVSNCALSLPSGSQESQNCTPPRQGLVHCPICFSKISANSVIVLVPTKI